MSLCEDPASLLRRHPGAATAASCRPGDAGDPSAGAAPEESDAASLSPEDLREDGAEEGRDSEESLELTVVMEACRIGDRQGKTIGVDQDDGAAAASFQRLAEQRRSWRSSIMIVSSHRDSLHAVSYEQHCRAYRERRARRWKDEGLPSPAASDRAVRFGALTIREFPVTLGDNPGCAAGPPLTIDWEPARAAVTLPLAEYEASRPPRRSHAQMLVPAPARVDILRRAGFGRNELVQLTRPVNVVRQQRRRTREAQNLDRVNYLVERVMRATKHAVTLGSRKREERRLLEPYVLEHKLAGTGHETLSSSQSSMFAMELSETECY